MVTWFLVLKIHRLLRSIIATLLEVQVAISYRFVKIIWVIFSVKLHFGRLCKLLQTPDVLVTSNLFQKSVKWQIIQNNHPLGVIICRCRLFHFFCRLLWNCNNRPPINCNNRCIFMTKNHVSMPASYAGFIVKKYWLCYSTLLL